MRPGTLEKILGAQHERRLVSARLRKRLEALRHRLQHLLVRGGELDLGRWQGVFLAEFDGPRSRTVRIAVYPA